MSSSARRLASSLARPLRLAFLLAAGGHAWAQAPRPVRLRYQAPAGCPDEAAFWATVRQRAPGARRAGADEQAPSYGVSIQRRGDLSVGRLEVEGASGRSLVREIQGESCEDAAVALAFVTALALEEDRAPAAPASAAPASASSAPGAPAPASPAPAPASSAPGAPASPAPVAPAASSGLAASAVAPATGGPTAEGGRAGASWSSGVVGAVAAGAVGTGAVGPGLALGAEVALEATWSSSLAPSVRLSGLYAASSADAGPGSASFQLRAVRLGGCPVSVAAGPVRIAPCASYELGSLRAQGQGVDEPVDQARVWHAVHLDARARWSPSARWFVELGAGLVLPLTSRSFVFEAPRTEVFTVPRVTGAGAAAVGMHFP